MTYAPNTRLISSAFLGVGLSLLAGCSTNRHLSVLPATSISSGADMRAILASIRTLEDHAIPAYKHIFIIIEENKAFSQILGNPHAPTLNRLAQTYGLASNYYGVVHPSQANYIAMLGGSTFGIHDDDAYYCQPRSIKPYCKYAQQSDYVNHTIASKSLMTQLEQRGLTWKGYFESIPEPGSKAVVAPSSIRALYAAKHNGFMAFKSVQDDPNLKQKVVGLEQLATDLQSGKAPNYSHIVFNQCHEMHGLAECPIVSRLIQTGDRILGQVVQQITESSVWSSPDNAAIVITWDEDDNPPDKHTPQGCCGFAPNSHANFGGGHIPTIVMTNHGPRGLVDPTPYNHYSLLRTVEDAFGIHAYLNEAGNTTEGVRPMVALFKK